MDYKPKFNLDDKVFHIANHQRPKWTECPMCKGSKQITLNGETESCPKCWGRGGEQGWFSEGWHVARSGWEDPDTLRYLEGGFSLLTIGQVRLEHTKGKRPEWTAMCRETGVGSGTIHHMDRMFATAEEAQAECDQRNSKQA